MKSMKELFLNLILETELFEMAYDRKKCIKTCEDLSHELCYHFIKVMLFPSSINVNHWKSEIKTWLNKIDDLKLKPNDRKMRYNDLILTLYEQPIGHDNAVKEMIQKMIKRDDIPYIQIFDYDSLHKRIEEMYHILCDDLSKDQMERVEYYTNMLKD